MLHIPGFQAHEALSESIHSIIYRGRREADDRPVILKMLKHAYPTPAQIARYQREYALTRALSSDGVIQVYDLLKHDNSFVMVLEDFGGVSVKTLMDGKPLPLETCLTIARRVTEILRQIHALNVMHKDINPSNIVYNPATGQIKLIDFGIATQPVVSVK